MRKRGSNGRKWCTKRQIFLREAILCLFDTMVFGARGRWGGGVVVVVGGGHKGAQSASVGFGKAQSHTLQDKFLQHRREASEPTGKLSSW
jgi:hypothetical protein